MTKPKLVTPSGGVRKVVRIQPNLGVKLHLGEEAMLDCNDGGLVVVPPGDWIILGLEQWSKTLARAVANSEPDEPTPDGLSRQQRRALRRAN